MDINKAIKKQNKSYKRFMLIMCFIFFALPLILYLSETHSLFLWIYLIVLELLILLAIFLKIDSLSLKYECEPGRIKVIQGLLRKSYNINCEKVVFVHAEVYEDKEGVDIVLLTNSRFRNRNVKAVDSAFLRQHAYVSNQYLKIKQIYPEEEYYYLLFSKGVLLKEKLLVDIYKNCVKSKYSSDAIECIKKWSMQHENIKP